jgi:hypothetical protein
MSSIYFINNMKVVRNNNNRFYDYGNVNNIGIKLVFNKDTLQLDRTSYLVNLL